VAESLNSILNSDYLQRKIVSKNESIILFLGFIAGVALCTIVYCWIMKPNLIREWEKGAIQIRVAEYYTNTQNKLIFRYLTEKWEE
jgi:hypothetical protein